MAWGAQNRRRLLVFWIMVASGTAAGQAAPEQHAGDKSGTNPANFSKTLQLRSEGYSLGDGDSYASKTELLYSLPLTEKSKLDFEVPFLVGTDLFGDDDLFGFGDVSISWKYRPYASKRMAVIAGIELFVPSGTREELSSNRWSVGPSVTLAYFFPEQRIIFAPTYEHQVSITDTNQSANFVTGGGDSNTGGAPSEFDPTTGDIQKGTLDLYIVYRFPDGKQWILVDPAITIDYEEGSKVSASILPAYGFFISKGQSITAQAIIPITDSATDWGLRLTFKQVF